MKKFFVSTFFICLLSSTIFAGIENRPANTDEAYILRQNELLFCLGPLFSLKDNKDFLSSIELDISYGLLQFWQGGFELGASVPVHFLIHNADDTLDANFGDISLRPEFAFLREGYAYPSLSLAGNFKLKTGDSNKGLGTGTWDYTVSLQASKNFGGMSYHLNFGYTIIDEPASAAKQDDVISYNIGIYYDLSGYIDMLVLTEFFGATNSDPTATSDPMEFLIGLIYKIDGNWSIDIGGGAGITSASPDFTVTTGVSYSL